MRIINHQQFGRRQRRAWRRVVKCLAVAMLLFLLANGAIWLVYRQRALPNSQLGAQPVGNQTFQHIRSQLSGQQLLPQAVELRHGTQVQRVHPEELGMRVDVSASMAALQQQRPLLPLVSFVRHQVVPVKLQIDESVFAARTVQLAAVFTQPAQLSHIIFTGQAFALSPASKGYELDTSTLHAMLVSTLQQGRNELTVPVRALSPPHSAIDLSAELQRLQKQLTAKITLTYQSREQRPGAADIGNWYISSGQTMVLSLDRVQKYVATAAAKLGATAAANAGDGSLAVSYAITQAQPITFVFAASNAPRRVYCTAVRGVDASGLPALNAKLAATYGDPRGWGGASGTAFTYATSGCQLTVWLVSPASMSSFGSICDPYYSCTVSPNVVINYDRWLGATDPWNKQHLGIEDYRALAINHETGHWLGFNHTTCPAAGQPAPVMMQQSVDLGGCTFNPWPVAAEINMLRQHL